MFQSLGRDSVCSDPVRGVRGAGDSVVSIPRSGFCVFRRSAPIAGCAVLSGFNPSVGILCVQTGHTYSAPTTSGAVSIPRSGFCVFRPPAPPSAPRPSRQFQSLGRDSVCSDAVLCQGKLVILPVSIPRSGFCVFRHGDRPLLTADLAVSIPRSGFCVFRPG